MLNVQLLKQSDELQQISQPGRLGHEKAVINPHVAMEFIEELQHAYYIYILLNILC